MPYSRDEHIKGVLRLIDPVERERAKSQLAGDAGRKKWLKRLAHNIEMHPQFSTEPPRGQRSDAHLLARLKSLGAPPDCYIISSDSRLDDTFALLEKTIRDASNNFDHGTILSCIPGRLALFRSAFPHQHFIVHRTD